MFHNYFPQLVSTIVQRWLSMVKIPIYGVGWDGVVGTGTRYGLMVRGLNLSEGEVFCTLSE
jgi:hypothetical protein